MAHLEWTYTLEELPALSREWWTRVSRHRVFAFHGGMGAGKTTLIRQLCKAAGVSDAVSSPTFSLVNEYRMGAGRSGTIYHIDLYRLRDAEEAFHAGVEDCLYSGAYCLVEWPERAPSLFPADTVHLHLEALPDGRRRLTMRIADDIG